MIPLRFHPDADSEMVDTAIWYESRQQGLGKRFLASVQEALIRIQANPKSFAVVENDVQRCFTRTFPFGVLYRHKGESIVIMAIMHLHREPGYWKERESDSGPLG